MKALIALVFGAFFISLNPVCAQTEGQKQEWSEQIVEAVRSKNFTWIIANGDSILRSKISDSLLIQTFTGLEGMYGKNSGFEKSVSLKSLYIGLFFWNSPCIALATLLASFKVSEFTSVIIYSIKSFTVVPV